MVLQSYCDESEMAEGGKRVLSVGALFAPPPIWEQFEPPWKAVLAEYGIDVFHTTDYEARRGPYEGWSNDKRVSFMSSLIEALGSPRPCPIGISCTVVLDEYEQALSEDGQRRFGSAYDHCAMWVINTIAAELGQVGMTQRVAYVFEQRNRQGRLRDSFDHAAAFIGQEKRLDTITTAPKDAFVPLQAADLWAFEASKDALRMIGAHKRDPRKSLQAMLKRGIGLKSILWRGPAIRELFDDYESGRAHMPEWFKNKDVPRKRWPKRP